MENASKHEVIILARMGEIALKGLNRGKFEHQLISNLKYRLRSLGNFYIFQSQSRLWIEPKAAGPDLQSADPVSTFTDDPALAKAVLTAVTEVFGIVSASIVWKFNGGMDEITAQARDFVGELLAAKHFKTFKVEAKRGEKRFPLTSPEICTELGGQILEAFPELTVDVISPDFVVYVEVRENISLYTEKISGHRGLPVGTAGKGMLLLSGGIDSPVAGYMMASRGMSLEAVYFHSYPYTSDRAKEKVIDLAKIVSHFAGSMTLHVVDFTSIQLEMYQNSPQDMLTITMRRVMLQIAEEIANQRGCKALITGESLGQVASQTLEAICLTNEVVKLPVFRPLIGTDKDDTILTARKIGTFETSILPFEDCCTVFVAKHPKTRPLPEHMAAAEKNLDIPELVARGLASVEKIFI
ncbi:MAG: tRNA uracil 4-sulfurtransferase ThiI [Eubacteriales bacterium]